MGQFHPYLGEPDDTEVSITPWRPTRSILPKVCIVTKETIRPFARSYVRKVTAYSKGTSLITVTHMSESAFIFKKLKDEV